MHDFQPTPQHLWLRKFVGEWIVESEMSMGPDQPPMKSTGREVGRMLGDAWVILEGTGTGHDGKPMEWRMTLGFDPRADQFVGSWIASAMPLQFVYAGTLDADGKTLPLDSDGPSFADDSKIVRYRDTYAFVDNDHRTLTGSAPDADGTYSTFMTTTYRRVK